MVTVGVGLANVSGRDSFGGGCGVGTVVVGTAVLVGVVTVLVVV